MKEAMVMFKRLIALMLLGCMLFTLPVLAEDSDEDFSDEELLEAPEILGKDHDYKYNGRYPHIGPLYEEKSREDFTLSSPALYRAKFIANSSAYRDRDIDSEKLIRSGANGKTVDVLYVGSYWAIIRSGGEIAYCKRYKLEEPEAVDPDNTPRYGTQKHAYIATTADVCEVRVSMDNTDACWVVLNPGTQISVWGIQDGWAIVNYWRVYGYIEISDLKDLAPVSPTDTPLYQEAPIAAYTSYYKMDQTESNINRINNIFVACQRLTGVLAPGETFNFNEDAGPYTKEIGYREAPVLINGKSEPGYGGGTCQVSSTLYNALLQLPGVEIVHRRPHGPAGADYLPHGVDAAVGNTDLNLIFTNRYDFPIRIEGHTSDDGALCMLVYRVWPEDAQ